MKYISIILLSFLGIHTINAQKTIPSVYTNIKPVNDSTFAVKSNNLWILESNKPSYTLSEVCGNPKGTSTGFDFDFRSTTFLGKLYYGFINYNDAKYSQAVYFKTFAIIQNGIAQIDMSILVGKYDMVNWEQTHKGSLAYRVVDSDGLILYDGILSFIKNDKFELTPTITTGPILSILTDSSVVVKYTTNYDVISTIHTQENDYTDLKACKEHEITLTNLQAQTQYDYEIICGENRFKYSFQTAPKKGNQSAFTFAYASDSRGGQGGGERNIYGTNAYILKKSMALASQQKAVFVQFTGDLINGYSNNVANTQLQYINFKHVVSPFTAYMPLYIGIGNHEAIERQFPLENEHYGIAIDRFPFETESMEAVFANTFAHPKNGPSSEDGEAYDPNPKAIDFPSYKENVYYYTYANIAVVVLNSEYLYASNLVAHPETSGGLHGYLMDGQLKWLEKTLDNLEKDTDIDHVFITQHTPAFPNGGHIKNAMWYYGDNHFRTIIAGNPLKTGIIEQRDKYLDIIINKSSKVVAILTGDEHNYCKTHINKEMNMYPENWDKAKLKLKRSIYQINNGACGAPYYAQETAPWTEFTSGFSTQNALVLIDVDGKKVKARVLNPDTLEEIEHYDLK